MKGQKKRKQKQQQDGPGTEKQDQPLAKKTRSRAKSTLQESCPSPAESQEDSRSQPSQDNGLSSSAVDEGLRPCHSQQEMNAESENANYDSESLNLIIDRTDNVALDGSCDKPTKLDIDHEPIDIVKDVKTLEHLSKEITENSSKDIQSVIKTKETDCVTFSQIQIPVKRKFQPPEITMSQTVMNDARDSQIKQPKLDASSPTMEVSNSSNEPTELMTKISSETDMTKGKKYQNGEIKTTETKVDKEKDTEVSKQCCSIDSFANKILSDVNKDELNTSHKTSSEDSRNNKIENCIENMSTSPEMNQTESASATIASPPIVTSAVEVTQFGHFKTESEQVEHNNNAQSQDGECTQTITKTVCLRDSQVCGNTQGMLATQFQYFGPTQPYLSANDTGPVVNRTSIEQMGVENVVRNENGNTKDIIINVEKSTPEIDTQSLSSEILFQRKISQESKGQPNLSQGFKVTNQINNEETQASSTNSCTEEGEHNGLSCNKKYDIEIKEPILSTPPVLNVKSLTTMFQEESLAKKKPSNLKDNTNMSDLKYLDNNLTDTQVSNMNDKRDNNEYSVKEYPKGSFTTKIFSRSHNDNDKDTTKSNSESEFLHTTNPTSTNPSPDLTDSQLCDALDEGDFEIEFDAAQTKANDDIVKKRQEGESLVGTILHELRTVNKQMLRLKRELETAKRKMKPTKPMMNK